MESKFGLLGAAVGGLIGAGTLVYTYVDGERTNAREQDLSFSQFAAKISRLEADLEQMDEDLSRKEQEIATLRSTLKTLGQAAPIDLAALEARLSELENRPSAQGKGPSVDAVAAYLMQNHKEALRGPQGVPGPQGPEGAKGEKGEPGAVGQAVSSGVNPRAPIQITTDYQSDFEDQYWGTTRVSLIGCAGKGQRVTCKLVLFPEADADLRMWSQYSRVALPSAEWVFASDLAFGGADAGTFASISLSKGIPIRLEMSFQLPSGGHEGLLALEVVAENDRLKAAWRDVQLAS